MTSQLTLVGLWERGSCTQKQALGWLPQGLVDHLLGEQPLGRKGTECSEMAEGRPKD